jgi:hypothetical protein
VTMKNADFWGVAPCRLCVILNALPISFIISHVAHSPSLCSYIPIAGCFRLVAQSASHLLTLVPRSRIFLLSRWKRPVPPKRRFTQELHGSASQKSVSSCQQMFVNIFNMYACSQIIKVNNAHISSTPGSSDSD